MSNAKSSLTIVIAALTAGTALFGASVFASSHREAPSITETPKLDGTDWYMFRSYESGREGFVTLIANYQPFEDPFGGPNYFTLDPNAVYEMHIDNNGDGKEEITFQFRFTVQRKDTTLNVGGADVAVPVVNTGQIGTGGNPSDTANLNVVESYSISIIRGDRRSGTKETITNAATGEATFLKPVDNIGEKTLPSYAAYAAAHVYDVNIPGCAAGRVFVGQRKDPFVIGVGEIFDLVNVAHPIGEEFNNSGRDDLASKNVTSLVLEVPIACLVNGDPVIGGWTTASACPPARQQVTGAEQPCAARDLTQVSRLGGPLVNELVIGLKDKDRFNASEPVNDGAAGSPFPKYVTNPTLPALLQTLFSGAGVQAPTRFPRDDLVAAFLTGIASVNQPSHVVPAEMLRLNTSVAPTPAGSQDRLGVIAGDAAGFPNGRRPGDDVVDIALRVVMGRLITLGLFGSPAEAPSGNLDFTDGALVNDSFFDATFPYLKTPIPGSPGDAQPAQPLTAGAIMPGFNPVEGP